MPVKREAFVEEDQITQAVRSMIRGRSREELLSLAGAVVSEQVDVLGYDAPKTPDELWQYIKDTWNIEISRVAVCSGHDAPFDFIWLGFSELVPSLFSIGSRGGGKSFDVALLHELNSRFKPGVESATFGAVEEQSKRVYAAFKQFIDGGLPEGDSEIVGDPRITETIFRNGSKVEILGGTVAAVNGPHPQKSHSDEVEIMRPATWRESRNLASDKVLADGRRIKAQNFGTSTRKYKNGRVDKIYKEFLSAKEKAIELLGRDATEEQVRDHVCMTTPFWVICFCIFEISEQVEGCRSALENKDRSESELCRCVLGDTKINPRGDLLGGYRRRYRGPLVELSTRSGKRLSITPNHPVLTDHGWVAAGLLEEGDYVVGGPSREELLTSDLDQMPTSAKDLFASLQVKMPSVRSDSVAPLSVDFHGDGEFTEGEVELVSTELGLSLVSDSALVEEGGEHCFAVGERPHEAEHAESATQSGVRYTDSARQVGAVFARDVAVDDASGDLGFDRPAKNAQLPEAVHQHRDREPASIRDRSVGLAGDVGVDDVLADRPSDDPAQQAEFAQVVLQPLAGDPHLIREGLNSLAVDVPPNDLVAENDSSRSATSDSEGIQMSCDDVVRDFDSPSDRSDGLASDVALDEIIGVKNLDFSGHVYNFSTTEEAYLANGIITHNCNFVTNGLWDNGEQRTLESVCRGRLYRSRGHRSYGEVVQLFLQNDRGTWEAQQECIEAESEGLYVKSFSRSRHGLSRFPLDPANGPIYTGTDWGSTDAAAVLWVQYNIRPVIAIRYDGSQVVIPTGSRIIFAEVYEEGKTSGELGQSAIVKEVKLASSLSVRRLPVRRRWADLQGAGDRRTWAKMGLPTAKYSTRSFDEQVKEMRGMFDAERAFVVVDYDQFTGMGCPQFCDQIEGWRRGEDGKEDRSLPQHAVSGGRYVFYGMHDLYNDSGALESAEFKDAMRGSSGTTPGPVGRPRSRPYGEMPSPDGSPSASESWRQQFGDPVGR